MPTAPTSPPADGAALPTPPSMSDPVSFATRGDAYFLAQVDFQAAMNLLKANVYTNSGAAYANALEAATSAANAATSAAAAALSAGAIPWVSLTVYAIGDRRTSPITGRLFIRRTVGAGSTDPSLDTTNWAAVQIAAPLQVVTGLTQLAVAGAAYNMTNAVAQAAATNICLWSEDFTQWTKTGTGSVSANSAMDPNGDMTMDKLTDSDVGADACHFSRSQTVANDSLPYVTSVKLKQDTAAATFVNAYFVGGTTVTAGVVITWGTTPSIAASGVASSPVLTYLGNGIYRASFVSANNSSGNTSHQVRIYPAGSNAALTGAVYAWGANVVQGTAVSSYIPTGATAVTRPASVIAPSRFILPAAPSENDQTEGMFSNGIDTNIVDPNGATVHGGAGPIRISRVSSKALVWVFTNATWELRA